MSTLKMNHTETFTYVTDTDGSRIHVKRPVSQFASLPSYRRLFEEEATTGLAWRHPHLLRYLRYGTDDTGPYIAMEYLPAVTLHEALLEDPLGINTPKESRQIMDQLFDAVNYLHTQGVLHLDLRPENILITRSAHDVKLVNPVSFYMGHSPSFVLFKERYAAPELFEDGKQPTTAADIYSLGRVMEYLFSYSTLSLGVSKVIARATADDPAKRYKTVEEMRRAFVRSERIDRFSWILKCVAALAVLCLLYRMFCDDRVPADIVPPSADTVRRPLPPSNRATDDEDEDDVYRISSIQQMMDRPLSDSARASLYAGMNPSEGIESGTSSPGVDSQTERLFKKAFRQQAEVMIAKIYTPKMMNGDEKLFLQASTKAFTELDRLQREIGEQYGLDVILSTRLSSDVINELTDEYMGKFTKK